MRKSGRSNQHICTERSSKNSTHGRFREHPTRQQCGMCCQRCRAVQSAAASPASRADGAPAMWSEGCQAGALYRRSRPVIRAGVRHRSHAHTIQTGHNAPPPSCWVSRNRDIPPKRQTGSGADPAGWFWGNQCRREETLHYEGGVLELFALFR